MNADDPTSLQLPGSIDVPMSEPAKEPRHANDKALFFRLPPELRNIVYEHLLGFIPDWNPPDVDTMLRMDHMPKNVRVDREPALLRVCRAIRAEARGIHYAGRRFTAMIGPSDIPLFTSWVEWVGQAHLSHVDTVGFGLITKEPFDAKVVYSVVEASQKVKLPAGKLWAALYAKYQENGCSPYIFHRHPSSSVLELLVDIAVAQDWDERTVHDWVWWARRSHVEGSLVGFWQQLKEIQSSNVKNIAPAEPTIYERWRAARWRDIAAYRAARASETKDIR